MTKLAPGLLARSPNSWLGNGRGAWRVSLTSAWIVQDTRSQPADKVPGRDSELERARCPGFADGFELATIKSRVRPTLVYWRGLCDRRTVARAIALPPAKPGLSMQPPTAPEATHAVRESK